MSKITEDDFILKPTLNFSTYQELIQWRNGPCKMKLLLTWKTKNIELLVQHITTFSCSWTNK
jgi:hypothetical protein